MYIKTKTHFNKKIRIRESQLEWLDSNKKLAGCKTMAGFLDIIINKAKKYDLSKMRKRDKNNKEKNIN